MRHGPLSLCFAILLSWQGTLVEQGQRAFDAERFAEAAKLFEQALGGGRECRVLLYLGMAQYRLGEREAAIVHMRAAVECDPRAVEARVALAEAYASKGFDNQALIEYEAALERDADN